MYRYVPNVCASIFPGKTIWGRHHGNFSTNPHRAKVANQGFGRVTFKTNLEQTDYEIPFINVNCKRIYSLGPSPMALLAKMNN